VVRACLLSSPDGADADLACNRNWLCDSGLEEALNTTYRILYPVGAKNDSYSTVSDITSEPRSIECSHVLNRQIPELVMADHLVALREEEQRSVVAQYDLPLKTNARIVDFQLDSIVNLQL